MESDNGNLLFFCYHNKHYKTLKYLVSKYKITENNLKRLEKYNYYISYKKILLINNLLNSKYNYNKIFDLIYKKN